MDMRRLINMVSEADTEFSYDTKKNKVIAKLKSYDSMVYTKLAKKLETISQLSDEIKALKEEVKSDTRQYIADLFSAEDEAKTRVVETVSFIFTLSKKPAPSETYKYSDIISELEGHLTPELIVVLNSLREKYKSTTQSEPKLKVEPIVKESVDFNAIVSYFKKYKNFIISWATGYDKKLNKLKHKAVS